MAGTKSAVRAARAAERKRVQKQSVRSQIKTWVRRAETAIAQDPPSAADAVKGAIHALDKAVAKGVLHANNTARRKSRLMKKFNAALAESQAQAAPSKEEKPASS